MAVEPANITNDQFNTRVANWGSKTAMMLKFSVRNLTSKGKGDLVRSLRMKARKYYGEIDRLTYSFDRHGVFFHKGVGRGHILQNGTVVRGSKPGAVMKATAMNSNRAIRPMVLRGSVSRKPVEWFNPVLDTRVPNLADMITEMRADQLVRATAIK